MAGVVGEGIGDDEIWGDGDEKAQEKEKGLEDHYMYSVESINIHPPKAGPEALELVVNVEQAVCIQRLAMQ